MRSRVPRANRRTSAHKRKLKVGARVRLRFGAARSMPAIVIEDVGPIGVHGRQIVRVRLLRGEKLEFDMPAEELSPAPA